MNKSRLFKLAHKLTKKVIQTGDNYRVTFGAAIKIVKAAYFGETSAQIKRWSKNGDDRFYINFEVPCTRFGGMAETEAGYIEVLANNTVSFTNIAEEYRTRVESALNALAAYHQTKLRGAIAQSINF